MGGQCYSRTKKLYETHEESMIFLKSKSYKVRPKTQPLSNNE